jgi:hypothetical protein
MLHVRSAMDKTIQDLLASIQDGDTVEPSAILIRPAPHFPAPSPSTDTTETLNAMLARESLVPSLSADPLASASNTVVQLDPPEAAFFNGQDPGYGFRSDCHNLRPDLRPALRSNIHRDDRPPSRKDLRGPNSNDFRPGSRFDTSRDLRPDAADHRPTPSTSLKDLQKLTESLQSQLDKHLREALQAQASPRAAFMDQTSNSDKMAYSLTLHSSPITMTASTPPFLVTSASAPRLPLCLCLSGETS